MPIPLFDEPGPRVFTAPPGLPFAQALAEGVMARLRAAGGDPADLADVEVVVSTRRGARALRSAFIRAGGGAALGPRLKTLAEIGADPALPFDAPPPIGASARRLALMRLVRALLVQQPALGAPSAAPGLAGDLEALLDAAQASGADLAALDGLAEQGHAEHWRLSAQFLDIIRQAWPAYLETMGRSDPAARNRKAVAALEQLWRERPPERPIIVAGSTGSLDTSAWFIELVSRLPQGAVVLPGLDTAMDGAGARSLADGAAPEHPQAGIMALIARIDAAREDVRDWAADPRPHAAPRLRLLSQALRPAPVTDAWRAEADAIAADAPAATRKMTLLEAASGREEALAIALTLREALETPGRTAALITPDRTLARRVSSELARWGVDADDSSGRPLALTPPGVFFTLVAEAVMTEFSAAPLLSLLKHPLCAAGRPRGLHLRAARRFEDRVLRRRRPAPGLAALRAAVAEAEREEAALTETASDERSRDALALSEWFEGVIAQLSPLADLAAAPEAEFAALVAAHAEAAQALATEGLSEEALAEEALAEEPDDPEVEPRGELYRRDAGEALESFVRDLRAEGEALGPIAPGEYLAVIGHMMAGETARRPHGLNPRALILGSLEARMQSADLVVIAGLNEGVWPQAPEPDAWISRDMRASIGLPPLESRVGLSAHDFFQAAMAGEVVMTRARRANGAPTVPSRWLLRLTNLLEGVAPAELAGMEARGEARLALAQSWSAALEAEAASGPLAARPAERPRPAPPLSARPKRLSVTEVETLIRDPYAIYAKHVLRLRPAFELDETPDGRRRGDALHAMVERFVRDTLAAPVEDWPAIYDRAAEAALEEIRPWPTLHAVWSARARRVRDWFLAGERARRAEGRPVALESRGALAFETALGAAGVTGIADRIDLARDSEGNPGYAIYDYKSGSPPSANQVEHFAKQLPLEAAILEGAGFAARGLGEASGGVLRGPVVKFAHIHLKGGRDGGAERAYEGAQAAELTHKSLEGLKKLFTAYADPALPYVSRLRAQHLRFEGDYDHLARFGEWTDGYGEDAA